MCYLIDFLSQQYCLEIYLLFLLLLSFYHRLISVMGKKKVVDLNI